MKGVIILVLILIIGALGYVVYSSNNESTEKSTDEVTSTNSGKAINLSGKNLREFPKNVLDDRSATQLDVSNNSLTGAPPAEIRLLSNLEILNVSNNQMTGIPAEVGQLTKLRVLNYADNQITGLPNEIGNLKNLETFDLRGNPNVSKTDIAGIQKNNPNTNILYD